MAPKKTLTRLKPRPRRPAVTPLDRLVSVVQALVETVESHERRLDVLTRASEAISSTRSQDVMAMNATVQSMSDAFQQFTNSFIARFEKATSPFLADIVELKAKVRVLEAFRNEHEEQFGHVKILGEIIAPLPKAGE
jgi:hypothetical protein